MRRFRLYCLRLRCRLEVFRLLHMGAETRPQAHSASRKELLTENNSVLNYAGTSQSGAPVSYQSGKSLCGVANKK